MFQQDLPIEQWRVVLLLHKRAMLTAGRNAVTVMTAAHAAQADLVALEAKFMLLAEHCGKEIKVKDSVRDQLPPLDEVTLAATAEGLHWPRANKVNLALFATVEYRKGNRAPLLEVTSVGGIDAVVKLAERGLAEVIATDYAAVEAAKLGVTKHAVLKTYFVMLTRRGQDLVKLA